jgi:hypothetical protein
MPKTSSDRIEALKLKKQQIANRLAVLEAKEKTAIRKRDTRKKIIVGAAVLTHAGIDADFAEKLTEILNKAVTRELDRKTIAELLSDNNQEGTKG